MTYDVDYFIKKFEAIPVELWITGGLFEKNSGRRCALGHCGIDVYVMNEESIALTNILSPFYYNHTSDSNPCFGEVVYSINDGFGLFGYLGSTPKQRILAALYDIKKLNQGTGTSTERRNGCSIEEQRVDITKKLATLPIEETSDLRTVKHPVSIGGDI